MRRLVPISVAALALLAAVGGFAVANAGEPRGLSEVRHAVYPFKDVAVAEAASYGEFRDAAGLACIAMPGVGGMGVHYVNGSLVGDTVLEPTRPEAIVYAPTSHGGLRLAAVEYIVFAEAWDAEHAVPPSLFGARFDYTPSPNRYGIPAFYALHAWVFASNPAGTFSPWNPRVSCGD